MTKTTVRLLVWLQSHSKAKKFKEIFWCVTQVNFDSTWCSLYKHLRKVLYVQCSPLSKGTPQCATIALLVLQLSMLAEAVTMHCTRESKGASATNYKSSAASRVFVHFPEGGTVAGRQDVALHSCFLYHQTTLYDKLKTSLCQFLKRKAALPPNL